MVEHDPVELTEDEAALYDRQIRLWGLDSQKRLRNANILLIGLKGLGAEVCKNIVLAGVKSITLLDSGNVTEEDFSAQFLAPRDQIGKNRAEASLARTQQLNPMVKIHSDTETIFDKPDSFFTTFTVVCATECLSQELIRINQVCREAGVKFFAGDVFGFVGYMFADLQIHEYAEDVIKRSLPVNDSGEPASKKSKIEPNEKITVKRTATFVPLQDAFDVDWSNETYSAKLPKTDPSYFMMRVLIAFRDEKGRDPSSETMEDDIIELQKIRDHLLVKLGAPAVKVPDSLLRDVFGKVSPVCAIVGGVLAQEIIKAVSQKDAPHNNMFFFNPQHCAGIVDCIGN